MATKVQIIIDVDGDKAEAVVGKVRSALDGMGGTAVKVTGDGTAGMNQFEGSMTRAVLGANLLQRAIDTVGRVMKTVIVDSTLLAARSQVLDTVNEQLARTTGRSINVIRAQQEEMRALGIDTVRAQTALASFITAELDTADAVAIANVARNRAQISGEDTSATMERLTRAILSQEVELLKLAGIVIRQEDAFKRYGATIGKAAKDLNEFERRQAFVNEILRFTRNDVGLYEAAWEDAGKRLLSIPRIAREAGIAMGREFQTELRLGVDATIQFLQFAERNAAVLGTSGKVVLETAAAYVALRLAIEAANVAQGRFIAGGIIAHFQRLNTAIATARLTALGWIGVVGGMVAAGLLLGKGLSDLYTHFRLQSIQSRASALDLDLWREKLARAGVETRDNAEANTILQRVIEANNNLRRAGLPQLGLTADLMERLERAEKQFARAQTDTNTGMEERAKKIEALREKLEDLNFNLRVSGISDPIERERVKAGREIDLLLAEIQKLNAVELLPAFNEAAFQKALDTQSKLAKQLADERDKAARELLAFIDANLQGIDQITAKRSDDLAKVAELQRKYPELAELAGRAEVAITESTQREITEIRERELKKRLDAQQRVNEQVVALEREGALAGLDAFQTIEFERLETIRRIEGDLNASASQIERARVAATQVAGGRIREENKRIADEQRREWERNAAEYDRFLDRIVRFTEQSGNFLTNIWRAISDEFQRSVTKMVLSWVFGFNQIGRTGGQTAGGGALGGLLGGVFGGGAPASAATPPFNPAAFASSFTGGSLLASAGGTATAGAGAIPGARPSGASAGLGALGGLFGGGALAAGTGLPQGINPAMLGLLLGISVGSGGRPGLGALAGIGGVLGGVALSGAAAGVAGGIGALGGIGVALPAFLTNPVGLAILGGVAATSVITGIITRGRKKEDATKIANEGFSQIHDAIRAFELRQSTFDRTIGDMNRVWTQMEQAWRQIGGGVGNNSITSQRPFFEQAKKHVERIQEERNRRGDLIAGLPLPEFATGGFVGGSRNQPVLAKVHAGEFVLNQRAVESIGRPQLESANAGGGMGSVTVMISTMDAKGVEEFLRDHEAEFSRAVVRTVQRNRADGGALRRIGR